MKALAMAKAARLGAHAREKQGDLVGHVAALGFGYSERSGMKLPTVAGIEPAALYGAVGALVVPRFVGGKAGATIEAVGNTLLDIALYKFGAGQPLLSGEDDGFGGFQW